MKSPIPRILTWPLVFALGISLGWWFKNSSPLPSGTPASTVEKTSGASATLELPVARHGQQQALPSRPMKHALSTQEVAARAQQWTVYLSGSGSYGAGILIDRRGYILTSLHVVEKMPSVQVTFVDGHTQTAEIVEQDKKLDLALLQLDGPTAVQADVASFLENQVGDDVLSVGAPRKMSFTVSRGMISYLGRPMSGVAYVQTDLPTNGGNSGGPVVNMRGEVIGVMSFILKNSQGLAFAIPIDYAFERFSHLIGGGHLDSVRFKTWKNERIITAEL